MTYLVKSRDQRCSLMKSVPWTVTTSGFHWCFPRVSDVMTQTLLIFVSAMLQQASKIAQLVARKSQPPATPLSLLEESQANTLFSSANPISCFIGFMSRIMASQWTCWMIKLNSVLTCLEMWSCGLKGFGNIAGQWLANCQLELGSVAGQFAHRMQLTAAGQFARHMQLKLGLARFCGWAGCSPCATEAGLSLLKIVKPQFEHPSPNPLSPPREVGMQERHKAEYFVHDTEDCAAGLICSLKQCRGAIQPSHRQLHMFGSLRDALQQSPFYTWPDRSRQSAQRLVHADSSSNS